MQVFVVELLTKAWLGSNRWLIVCYIPIYTLHWSAQNNWTKQCLSQTIYLHFKFHFLGISVAALMRRSLTFLPLNFEPSLIHSQKKKADGQIIKLNKFLRSALLCVVTKMFLFLLISHIFRFVSFPSLYSDNKEHRIQFILGKTGSLLTPIQAFYWIEMQVDFVEHLFSLRIIVKVSLHVARLLVYTRNSTFIDIILFFLLHWLKVTFWHSRCFNTLVSYEATFSLCYLCQSSFYFTMHILIISALHSKIQIILCQLDGNRFRFKVFSSHESLFYWCF